MAKSSGGVRHHPASHKAPVQRAFPGMIAHSDKGVLMRHLKGLEENPAYFNRDTERLYVFNRDGSLDYTESQHVKVAVLTSEEQNVRLKDKIILHNHPTDTNLSMGDVWLTTNYDAYQVRATSKSGTYILTRPKGGWPPMDRVEAEINDARSLAVQKGGIRFWTGIFAKVIGADFTFVPRSKE